MTHDSRTKLHWYTVGAIQAPCGKQIRGNIGVRVTGNPLKITCEPCKNWYQQNGKEIN
jgi:hypothetical protein